MVVITGITKKRMKPLDLMVAIDDITRTDEMAKRKKDEC